MEIWIAFGKDGKTLNLPDSWDVQVVEPVFTPGLPDPHRALCTALESPIEEQGLAKLAHPGQKIGIIVNDISRATPTPAIVKAILTQLDPIPVEDITIFNALGTHRENTDVELRRMIGDDLVDRYRIVQNNCLDRTTQMCLGQTKRGNPVWINRELMACDLKILTGFIEPHFFAGFSGGGKAIMPGMAGLETILGNHSAVNIANPLATWGITTGNPIWEEVREAAQMAGRTFLVNVSLNRNKEITAVFAGNLEAAHQTGCEVVKKSAMVEVNRLFDIVVTSNSGYPLDLNLYQAVKGMSAAAQVVRPGGAILAAAECWDGIPDHGLFGQLLRDAANVQTLLSTIKSPGFSKQDQWQAQILGQILLKAEVHVYNRYLSPEQLRKALVQPVENIEQTLSLLVKRYGPQARICILPEGPVTIPFLKEQPNYFTAVP
jgi:lactate racemase